MSEEIWKDIEGFEGSYQVSSLGRVRSLDRQIIHPLTGPKFLRGCIITLHKARNGYSRITLCRDGVRFQFSVHRLVAKAFIPNPNNLPEINHKDENKVNNRADNLEWCTREYNNNYGNHFRNWHRYSIKHGRRIEQLTSEGLWIATYANQSIASRITGVHPSLIGDCCKGRIDTACGYRWRSADKK